MPDNEPLFNLPAQLAPEGVSPGAGSKLPALHFLLGLALAAFSHGLSAQALPTAPPGLSPLTAPGELGPPDAALATALSALKARSVVSRSEPQVPVMQELYRRNGLQPLWIRGSQVGESTWTALARLRAASLHGLAPADYQAAWLGERLASLRDATAPVPAAEVAQLDVTITLALLRYLADLHHGRAAKRQISGKWDPAPGFPDVDSMLQALPDPFRLQHFIDAAAPAYPMYGRLLKARATYEALIAADREAPQELVLDGKITPGGESDLLGPIAARLIELGDLASSATVHARYEGDLVEAVKRFQRRHGLDEDGVVGKGTFAALQTPNRQRLRQIDLAMERLRWLPPLVSDRVIGINIPEFKLWALARDGSDGQMKSMLQSRVVVGKQGRNATPVFIAQLTAIDFSPYWNVPISIARGEILPRLRRDPGYLARQEMEFVAADNSVSQAVTAAHLAAVERGAMRIRQRPGEKNALGNVKFTLPNSMNIYLHDTPSRSLFAQSRRDFSHGCIRVEEPQTLAQWALADDPAWDEAAIGQAMEAGKLRVVRLAKPIPVVLYYTTATVDEDGTLRFLPDVYGYDRKLDAEMPAAP